MVQVFQVQLEPVAQNNAEAARRDANHARVAVRRTPACRPDVPAERSKYYAVTAPKVYLRSCDVTELAERINDRDRDSTLRGRSRDRVAQPGEEGDEGSIRLCHEKPRHGRSGSVQYDETCPSQGDVARSEMHRASSDDEANDTKHERYRNMPEPLAALVRVPENSHERITGSPSEHRTSSLRTRPASRIPTVVRTAGA